MSSAYNNILLTYWSSWWRCCLGHSKNFCDDDDDDDDDMNDYYSCLAVASQTVHCLRQKCSPLNLVFIGIYLWQEKSAYVLDLIEMGLKRCMALACLFACPSVCLSVCRARDPRLNGSTYRNTFCIVG